MGESTKRTVEVVKSVAKDFEAIEHITKNMAALTLIKVWRLHGITRIQCRFQI